MEDEKQEEQTPEAGAEKAPEVAGISGVTLGIISTNEPSVTELPLEMTQESISVDDNVALPRTQHPNDVKFKVRYKPDFKGEKTLPEGSVQVVSKESADHFTKLGFGSVIK